MRLIWVLFLVGCAGGGGMVDAQLPEGCPDPMTATGAPHPIAASLVPNSAKACEMYGVAEISALVMSVPDLYTWEDGFVSEVHLARVTKTGTECRYEWKVDLELPNEYDCRWTMMYELVTP